MAKSLLGYKMFEDGPYQSKHPDSTYFGTGWNINTTETVAGNGHSDWNDTADHFLDKDGNQATELTSFHWKDRHKNNRYGGYLMCNIFGDTMQYIEPFHFDQNNPEYWHSTAATFSSIMHGGAYGLNHRPFAQNKLNDSKGRLLWNKDDYVTLPDGTRGYGITLVSRYDDSNQLYTNQYNGNGLYTCRTRVGQKYRMSFWAKKPRMSGQGDGPVGPDGNELRNAFGVTAHGDYYDQIHGGELDVWVFGMTSSGNAFGTGTGSNSYHYLNASDNGSHTNMGTKEGIAMRLNGYQNPFNADPAQDQTEGTELTTAWQYYEYFFTIDIDNSASSGAFNTEYLTVRIDQNKSGLTASPYAHYNERWYVGVSIANWCLEAVDVSMTKIKGNPDYADFHTGGTVTLDTNGLSYN